MSTKLLVALQPGFTDTPAIVRAHALGKKVDVDIVLYSAVYDMHVAGLRLGDADSSAEIREVLMSRERRKLGEVKCFLRSASRSIRIEAEWQPSAAEGIARAGKRTGADLVIASSTRHSVASRLVRSNTAWQLLRMSAVPVLFAHHRSFTPYRTVLAAVDPWRTGDVVGGHDDSLIALGTWFGDAFDGDVHLGHAFPPARPAAVGYGLPAHVVESWREDHSRTVRRLAARHLIDNTRIHLVDDSPARAIPWLADHASADLVVLGAGSRSVLERIISGRTSERVLDRLTCDVVVVPMSGNAVASKHAHASCPG